MYKQLEFDLVKTVFRSTLLPSFFQTEFSVFADPNEYLAIFVLSKRSFKYTVNVIISKRKAYDETFFASCKLFCQIFVDCFVWLYLRRPFKARIKHRVSLRIINIFSIKAKNFSITCVFPIQ